MVAEALRLELGSKTEVIWFGSWMRGDAVPRSDLDVAYRAAAGLSADDRLRAIEAVESLPTLFSVDLVDLDRASAKLRDEVLRSGVRL